MDKTKKIITIASLLNKSDIQKSLDQFSEVAGDAESLIMISTVKGRPYVSLAYLSYLEALGNLEIAKNVLLNKINAELEGEKPL